VERLNVAIDAVIATQLLNGIVHGTRSFQHPYTNAKAEQIASQLHRAGANLEPASSGMFRAKRTNPFKLWGLILGTLHLDTERRIVWAHMTRDMADEAGAAAGDSEGVVEDMAGIREADLAGFLEECEPGNVHVSLRSCGSDVRSAEIKPGIDCTRICRAFGGGGDFVAAGATIDGTIDDAERMITEVFDELWQSGRLSV
jgi:phosphoesterase RecJ-like protein